MVAPDRIDVVDQLNNMRLLGSIFKPYQTLSNPYYTLAVMPYLMASASMFDPSKMPESISPSIYQIHMTITWITSEDHWSKRAAFATTATLKELMMIKDFRLPGESDEAAYRRSWML